jgi:hypothetical protein
VYCIDDKPNGIVINHSSDWSGEVRIGWYVASERRDLGPTPPSLRECWCVGKDLVAGRFTPLWGTPSLTPAVPVAEPPINVITRAIALAVETYLRGRAMRAAEDLFIQRGKL